MKRLLVCSALLAFSLPGLAQADCVPETDADEDSTCVVMERDGQRGVWFDLETADRLRRFHLEVPELRLQIQHLGQLNEVQAARVANYREAAILRQEALETANAAWEAALQRVSALQNEMGAWYREPVLWLAVGVIVTAAAFIGGAFAL